jgi:hypothetical protein
MRIYFFYGRRGGEELFLFFLCMAIRMISVEV